MPCPPFQPLKHPCLTLLLFLSAALPGMVSAHPLGDFSINQYFIVDGTGPVLRLHYLLDVAEIPSFTELDLLDTNYDSEIGQAEVETYLAERIPQLERHLTLSVDGEPTPLTLIRHKLILLQGNAGMVVFNILLDLEARSIAWPPDAPVSVRVKSENYPREQGTRECLVLPGPDMADATETTETLKALELDGLDGVYTARTADFSLRLAPGDTPDAPVDAEKFTDFSWTSTVRLARKEGEAGVAQGIAQAMVEPGFQDEYAGGPGKPLLSIAEDVSEETVATGTREAPDTMVKSLMDRISVIVRDQSLPFPMFLLGLGIAALLGMGHALAPGHGKTVMAAYLIGERGTVFHAVVLGIVVTVTHTWSVIFLGLVTLYFEGYLSEEQVNFWTGILSGVIIVVIGLILFRQRYHQYLARAQGKDNDWRFYHGHEHDVEEAAPALPDGPPRFRNVLWLGVSGGVVPCPAALIVLLLALKVGRLSYGLALILAFSLGLAAVLVIIGILVVRASRVVQNTAAGRSGIIQALPLGSAILITLLGLWVVVWTLLQFEVLQFG